LRFEERAGESNVSWPHTITAHLVCRDASTADRPLFIGIARDDELERYLRGAEHDEGADVRSALGAADGVRERAEPVD